MGMFGFALLPREGIQRLLVDFRREHSDEIAGPALGMDSNLPHTTLLQCPYQPDLDYLGFLQLARGPVASSFVEVCYQPVGWVFARVARTPELVALQGALLEATTPLIDTSRIDRSKDMRGYSERERMNYLAYGYRYLKEQYRPHVTLGRTACGRESVSAELVDDFRRKLTGTPVVFDRLAFYEAGEFGVMRRVVCSTWLR